MRAGVGRRRSHTAGDKLDSRPDDRQHAGEVRSGPIATSLTPDAKHSPTFSFIHRVDASHHNDLFYGPYGTSYEIHALARPSGEVIERCWFLGTCQMLLRVGKLPLVFQGTAAKPVARRISARSRHCRRPNRTAGEWWTSREVSDRSGRQTAPDFARSDIRFSLFRRRMPSPKIDRR